MMYKTKVWLHITVIELNKNKGQFYVDYTFMNEPKNGEIIYVSEDMTKDIEENNPLKKDYIPSNYVITSAKKMFDPKINDGFSYSAMAIKVQ